MTERNPGSLPPEEEAAWARIVAGYGEEAEPPGEGRPEDGEERGGQGPEGDTLTKYRQDGGSSGHPHPLGPSSISGTSGPSGITDGPGGMGPPGFPGGGTDDDPVRSFTVYEAGAGPRDWVPPDEEEDGEEDEDGEGHFVPPEPPPLPETDAATKFAWIAVLGGPLLMLGTVLTGQPLKWWIVTLGVGGFLGGFGTLVARMRDDEDGDQDDPGRGAVV